jgi:glycosyltransferase involved in cell wall biosynthesis
VHPETTSVLADLSSEFKIDHILFHQENLGLGPSINQALMHISALNSWGEFDSRALDPGNITQFICYCQDDLLYTKGWLERLAKMYMLMEKQYNLGFASGVECVEHAVCKDIGNGMLLKDWIRAAQMFGRREYWMSMYPITRFDPETGNVRAKPNNGIGSGVDWHFIRNHPNSVCKSGKTCLVIPGLVKHMGYKESTWLNRELPESESDKRAIEEDKK